MDVKHLTGRIDPNSISRNKEQRPNAQNNSEGLSFSEVLNRESKLNFSGHAVKRLKSRFISMDSRDMQRLEEAVNRAEQKGSKDSLVLDGDRAFLVNISSKKVITAVDMMELQDKVFTNIDSTVLTKREL
ncbi:MAG TPA: TIGR02530 family flagellar biosynthesis protein [Balneolaceae bacterium]|nr:TIGR02530 family flagellar biosynthesis protein [Balneolaceae bacterium]